MVRSTLARITSFGTGRQSIRPVPFWVALSRLHEPGYRRVVAAWALVSVAVIPSGTLTRLFEWTGIPVHLGGGQVFLTVYLPLLVCVPLVLWLGYWWAAIPAYLSTFGVALLGGMPLPWIFVFSFANPLGLGALHLAYRAFPMRADLRSLPSILYFVPSLFVSSLVGSAGSFVWAYSNEVGANQFYPVWQGWWLGGFLQGILLVAPLLYLTTPAVERWKARLGVETIRHRDWDRRSMLVAAGTMIGAIAAYVLTVRAFMFAALERTLSEIGAGPALRADLENILEGLSLPQYVLVTVVGVTLFLGFRVGLTWSLRYLELAKELEEANERLQRLAITDALTGIFNRGHLLEVLPREISASRRHGRPLACLVLDIDHFKAINDRFGHLAGDDVLVQVAELVAGRLRREDLLARFGGEEFVILLPDTDTRGAFRVAEDMRRTVAAESFDVDQASTQVTVSIGVAELADVGATVRGRPLLAAADEALYRAKEGGRNRTITARQLSRVGESVPA